MIFPEVMTGQCSGLSCLTVAFAEGMFASRKDKGTVTGSKSTERGRICVLTGRICVSTGDGKLNDGSAETARAGGESGGGESVDVLSIDERESRLGAVEPRGFTSERLREFRVRRDDALADEVFASLRDSVTIQQLRLGGHQYSSAAGRPPVGRVVRVQNRRRSGSSQAMAIRRNFVKGVCSFVDLVGRKKKWKPAEAGNTQKTITRTRVYDLDVSVQT